MIVMLNYEAFLKIFLTACFLFGLPLLVLFYGNTRGFKRDRIFAATLGLSAVMFLAALAWSAMLAAPPLSDLCTSLPRQTDYSGLGCEVSPSAPFRRQSTADALIVTSIVIGLAIAYGWSLRRRRQKLRSIEQLLSWPDFSSRDAANAGDEGSFRPTDGHVDQHGPQLRQPDPRSGWRGKSPGRRHLWRF
jgi:hypothetical protein